jgi:hypothetical protein
MKKLIFGSSLFLVMLQNGFAYTSAEFDSAIKREHRPWLKQVIKCSKVASIPNSDSVNVCLKAIDMTKNKPIRYKSEVLHNTATVYYFDLGDKVKAYKYWKKASDLGNIGSQKHLSIMCNQDAWACK